MSSTSVGSFSPGKRHSQIPVLSRFNLNSQRVKAKKRVTSIDMISPRSFTYHNRTGPPRTSNVIANESRSNSPLLEKQTLHRGKLPDDRSKSSCMRNPDIKNKPAGISERSWKNGSVKKDISKTSVNYTKSYTTITLSPSPRSEDSDRGLQQLSITDSKEDEFSLTEKLSPPGEANNFNPSATSSKTSLNKEICPFRSPKLHSESLPSSKYSKICEINNMNEDEPHLELLDLSINDSESLIYSTVPSSINSSTGEVVMDGSYKEDELQVARGAYGTASGDELAFSSPIEFEINGLRESYIIPGEIADETPEPFPKGSDDEITALVTEGLALIDDDTNEYDSGETTEVDEPGEPKYPKSETDSPPYVHLEKSENNQATENKAGMGHAVSKSIRFGRENEIFTDVSYRQFVYHPTVLKRKTRDCNDDDERGVPGAKSLQDGAKSKIGDSQIEKGERSIKTSFKKNIHQAYVSNRDVNITPLRTWSDKNPEHDDTKIYDRLHMMGNARYVFKGYPFVLILIISSLPF